MTTPLALLCMFFIPISDAVASSSTFSNQSSSTPVPTLVKDIIIVAIVLVVVAACVISCRRARVGNQRTFRARRNPIDVPPGGRNFRAPPLPYFQPPPLQPSPSIPFPSPSIPPLNNSPPSPYAPPRQSPRLSFESRPPPFPVPQSLPLSHLQPPASSLSRGPSGVSSLYATTCQHDSRPPTPSYSSQTLSAQPGTMSVAGSSSSAPPLLDEMTSYQKTLADQERRNDAIDTMGGPSDPPPQYSE